MWNGFSPTEVARQGFMMVIQDVRGRYASDGAWAPLRQEGHDGADTIAWAAELRGSNGRVAMLGGSYCSHAPWGSDRAATCVEGDHAVDDLG
jgi:putative CocE/NonD family hydrolase